jgi:epoxyqueuosine reductase
LCIDACPTGALDEPGTLDATKCLSYWTQAPHAIPVEYRAPLEAQVYGCDICQDVCPWNRGIEKRRSGAEPPAEATPHVSLVDWLEQDADALRQSYERLYVPKNDGRYLRRNAIVALGNAGTPDDIALLEPFASNGDPLLQDHAEWAIGRIRERHGA